ncbi:MAG: bifunctional diaminohydroxyphosphoribosylaminopyrimidine deaminase/5-amino-6-(5-phosphoribosylamino)uracil reductase RibD [archaeon]
MNEDEKFMQKCIELAKKGRLHVSPNPMVGALVAKNGKIIAQGFHGFFGSPHAEAIALKKAGKKARGATLYASLEPCCHFGKQPPCTDAIIRAKIKKTVVGAIDPNPLVLGKGIKELQKHGIKTVTGVLEKESQELNEKFFKFKKTKKPFVLVKNAVSLDGKISFENPRKKISGTKSIKKMHELRSEFDAILVGANTAMADDPLLTSRISGARNPLRVIVDSKAKVPLDARVFGKEAGTIVVCTKKASAKKIRQINEKGAGVIVAKEKNGQVDLKNLAEQLGKMGISSVLVEGGAKITASFLKENLADKMMLIVSPLIIGSGKDFLAQKKMLDKMRIKKIGFVGKDAWVTLCPRS